MTDQDNVEHVDIVLETTFGNIVVRPDAANAPGTVENFLHYVDGGFHDGGKFHRTVWQETSMPPLSLGHRGDRLRRAGSAPDAWTVGRTVRARQDCSSLPGPSWV